MHCLAAIACLICAFVGQPPAANLLVNGGFEKLAPDGLPIDWQITGKGAGLDSQIKHSGSYSLRFQAPTPEMGNMRALSGPIRVEGTVRVSAWVKTQGVLPGAHSWDVAAVRVYTYDAAGQPLKKHWGHFDVAAQKGTADWTHYEVTLQLYREVKIIRVACLLEGGATGTVWFDDIVVEKVPERPHKSCKVKVVSVDLPAKYQKAAKIWPDEVLSCRIKGNQIVKNGRPAFLIGAWSLREDTWLCRVLGLDYTMLNMGDYTFFARPTESGEFEIGWGDAPWPEAMMRDALTAGLMVRIDLSGANERASHLRPVREMCPEIFVPHGHTTPTSAPIMQRVWTSTAPNSLPLCAAPAATQSGPTKSSTSWCSWTTASTTSPPSATP